MGDPKAKVERRFEGPFGRSEEGNFTRDFKKGRGTNHVVKPVSC